jgi:hypothetical protein
MKQVFFKTMLFCIATTNLVSCAFEAPITLQTYRENGAVYTAEELPQAIASGKIGNSADPLVSISVDKEEVVGTKIYNEQAKLSLLRKDAPSAPDRMYYTSLSTYNKTLVKVRAKADSIKSKEMEKINF